MRFFGTATVILSCSLLCVAAAAPVNFSGTWVLDPAKSDLGRAPTERGGGFPGGIGRGGGFPGSLPGGSYPGGGYPGGGYPGGGYPGGGYPGGGYPGGGSRRTPDEGGGPDGRETRAPQVPTTLVIEQTEAELLITGKNGGHDDPERDQTQVYNLAGETSTNSAPNGRGEMETRSSWQKDKLVTLGTQSIQGRNGNMDVTIKEEMSLSKDGQELTLKRTRGTQRGNTTSKLVYRKQ